MEGSVRLVTPKGVMLQADQSPVVWDQKDAKKETEKWEG